MTAEQFHRLPMLLDLAQVRLVTGWTPRTLRKLVRDGSVRRVTLGRNRGKYVRADIARICGLAGC